MEPLKNSVIVFIKRLPQFAAAAQNKELEEYFIEGQRGYGAYFAPGSARVATGLTPTEEDLLLPYILNIPKEDRDFRKQVNDFYEAIDVKVPGRDGYKLETGLTSSNSKPMDKDNLPLNIDQYIKYKHALGHPWIAPSEAEGKGNQLKQYYLFNPSEVSKTTINVNEQKDTAFTYYLSVKENPRTVAMYLTLLGVRVDQLRSGDEVTTFRNLVETRPKDFIKIYEDRDKELKYAIEDMINNKILERVAGNILIKEDGTNLGTTMQEAILFLQNSRNTKVFSVLKARLQEKQKATSVSVETEEDLVKGPLVPEVPSIPQVQEKAATQLTPAMVEPDVALVEGSAAELDD
jgi:hypothetical protein